jgi:hypothetical protein
MCCKLLGVPELDKPVSQWCVHCKPGRGCDAYDERPHTCRIFSCLWLTDPIMPEAFRPDRVKVVLGSTNPRVINVFCDPADPLAWRRQPIYSALKQRVADLSRPVIMCVRSGTHMWVMSSSQELDAGHVDPLADLRFDPAPGGGVKVVVLPARAGEPDA